MKTIHYKSDFKLFEQGCDFGVPFRFRYTAGLGASYEATHVDGVYTNCRLTDDGRLMVIFDNHGLTPGQLVCERHFYLTDQDYHDGICDLWDKRPVGITLGIGQTEGTDIDVQLPPYYQQGEPGAPFRYEDFTPEQIAELQRPATDAAAVANEAAAKASDAATKANTAASKASDAAAAAQAATAIPLRIVSPAHDKNHDKKADSILLAIPLACAPTDGLQDQYEVSIFRWLPRRRTKCSHYASGSKDSNVTIRHTRKGFWARMATCYPDEHRSEFNVFPLQDDKAYNNFQANKYPDDGVVTDNAPTGNKEWRMTLSLDSLVQFFHDRVVVATETEIRLKHGSSSVKAAYDPVMQSVYVKWGFAISRKDTGRVVSSIAPFKIGYFSKRLTSPDSTAARQVSIMPERK